MCRFVALASRLSDRENVQSRLPFSLKFMRIADYKTFVMKKVQQDINNRRKRLGQNKVKILQK